MTPTIVWPLKDNILGSILDFRIFVPRREGVIIASEASIHHKFTSFLYGWANCGSTDINCLVLANLNSLNKE